MQREAICRGSRCGDFQTDRWRRSLWRGNERHFSYQDLSLDKAYIIGFSLKDNLKNLPKTKREINIHTRKRDFSHPDIWVPCVLPDTEKVPAKAMSWCLCHNDDHNRHSFAVSPLPGHTPAPRPHHHPVQQVGPSRVALAGKHDGRGPE